ncbi:MAG: hypothetical protein J6D31_01930 [Clostridia bacterium]|nr:hypothetical protein [Clostridia bacterium]
MKKKLVFPTYSAVALAVVALISFSVWGIDRYCERGNTIYISLLHLGLSDILMSMFFIGGGMLISAVALLVCKNFRFTLVRVVVIAAVCLWVGYCLLGVFINAAFSPSAYVEVSSPDGQHRIVIGEDAYVFSPYGGDVYEITSPFTMHCIGRYEAEKDFFRPFSDGDYEIKWYDTYFELYYDYDGEPGEYEVLRMDYVNSD